MQKHQSFAKFQQKCNQFMYRGLIATQKLSSGCYVTKIYATLKNITKSRCVYVQPILYTQQKIYFNSFFTRLAYYIIRNFEYHALRFMLAYGPQ